MDHSLVTFIKISCRFVTKPVRIRNINTQQSIVYGDHVHPFKKKLLYPITEYTVLELTMRGPQVSSVSTTPQPYFNLEPLHWDVREDQGS